MAIDQRPIQLSSEEFAYFCQQVSEKVQKDSTERLQPAKDDLLTFIAGQVQARAESVATINEMFSATDQAIDRIFNDKRLTHEARLDDISERLSKDWGRLLIHEEAVTNRIDKTEQNVMAQMELKAPEGFDTAQGELRAQEIRRTVGAKVSDPQQRFQLIRHYEQVCESLEDPWLCFAVEIGQQVPYLAVLNQDEIERGRAIRRKAEFPAQTYMLEVLDKRRESFKTLLFRARRSLLELGYIQPENLDAELQNIASNAVNRRRNMR